MSTGSPTAVGAARRALPTLRTGLLAALLAGCAAPRFDAAQHAWQGPDILSGEPSEESVRSLPMFAGADGRPLGWDDLLEAVAWADVIIVGEQHDDAVGHAVQRAIVEDTVARHPRSALSMEMLERDEQPLVDDYFEGIVDAERFARLTHSENWGGKGRWHDWYQPIVDAARDGGGTVVAANAPRRYVRLARLEGYARLDRLPSTRRAWVDHPPSTPEVRERFWEVMSESSRPEAAPAMEPAPTAPDEEENPAEADVDDGDAVAESVPTSPPDEPATDGPESERVPTSQPAEPAEEETDDAEPAPDAVPTSQPDAGADEVVPAEPEPAEEETTTDDAAGDAEEAQAPPMMVMPTRLTDEDIAALFRSQLVWDATMAESIAGARRRGAGKVVHLVGQFHCDFDGGTVQELRRRLPSARVLVISMQRAWPGVLRDEDFGRADIVLYTGERPPDPEPEDEDEDETAKEEAPAE